jgi:plasmid maintenance system antidote protein VapI
MSRKRRKVRFFPAANICNTFTKGTEFSVMASVLEMNRRTIHHWVNSGIQISEWDADRYAVKLGLHPSEIWDDWFALEKETV